MTAFGRLANERQPTHMLKQAAIEAGMRTLRHDGWDRVLARHHFVG